MFSRVLAFSVTGLLLAACATSSDEISAEDVEWAKEIIAGHCVLAASDGAGSVSHTDSVGSMAIHEIVDGAEHWTRIEMSSKGVRGNVYYNTLSKRTVCGSQAWKDLGYRFEPIGG